MPNRAMYYAMMGLMFIAGVAIGLWFGNRNVAGNATASARVIRADGFTSEEARDRVEQNVIYTKRIKELEDELVKKKSDEVLRDHLQLLKKYARSMGLSPFDSNLKVTPQMAEFLKITPEEQKAVEVHLAQTQSELKELLVPRVAVVSQSDTEAVFKIPVADEGVALKKRLTDQISTDLGSDRAAAFLEMSEWEANESLYGFGSGPIEVKISRLNGSSGLGYSFGVTYANGSGTTHPFDGHLESVYQGLIPFEPTPAP